jgi:sugar phosphate isomerase/epimerase
MKPVSDHARARGVRLMIEPTNPALADLNLPHTLATTIDVAAQAGIEVCLDVHHVWTERRLEIEIASIAGSIGLVQVADYVPGTRGPWRAPPGDGVIPLERILGWVLDGGYEGLFDLELSPGNDDEAHRRGFEHLAATLERLGAPASQIVKDAQR